MTEFFNPTNDTLADDDLAIITPDDYEAFQPMEPQQSAHADGRFTMDHRGLHFREKPDRPARRITMHPFTIVARVCDAGQQNPGTMLRWVEETGVVQDMLLPDSDLHGQSLATVLAQRGFRVVAYGDRQLKLYLSTLESARRRIAYNRAGWHADDRLFILPDGTCVGPESGAAIYLRPKPTLVQQQGTLAGWQAGVARYAAGNSRLLFALSNALSGALMHLVGETFLAFHLVGPSSIGKSTALYLAASVWGARKAEIRTWRATDNGLEGVATETSDLGLFLDEMGQCDPKVAGEIVYMLGNGTGKMRAERQGDARESKRWLASVLSTGELTLETALRSINKHTTGGLDVRMANIPADTGAGMGMFQNIHGHSSPAAFADAIKHGADAEHGTAGRAFLTKLLELVEEIGSAGLRQYLMDQVRDYTAHYTPPGADGQVARVVSKFALVIVAGRLACEMGIFLFPADEVEAGIVACLHDWLTFRGTSGSKEDANVIQKVRTFIAEHGEKRFTHRSGACHADRERAGWTEVVGDRVAFYINADVFAQIVAPTRPTEAIAALHSAGLADEHVTKIRVQQTSTAERKTTRARVYTVYSDILESE